MKLILRLKVVSDQHKGACFQSLHSISDQFKLICAHVAKIVGVLYCVIILTVTLPAELCVFIFVTATLNTQCAFCFEVFSFSLFSSCGTLKPFPHPTQLHSDQHTSHKSILSRKNNDSENLCPLRGGL